MRSKACRTSNVEAARFEPISLIVRAGRPGVYRQNARFTNVIPGLAAWVTTAFKYLCFFLVALLLTSGCASIHGQPLTKEMTGDDPDAQMAYWHTLPDRKVVSNDEAFHGLLLFIDSQDPSSAYAQRVQKLKAKGMLAADFNQPADAPASRGTLAIILTHTLSIHGGVTMHLFGDQPRYAVRELVYTGLYPLSSPQQVFSGAQFLGIIGRAEDYQRDNISGTAQMNADEAANGLLSVKPAGKTP